MSAAKPRYWDCWSPEERALWAEVQADGAQFSAHLRQLEPLLTPETAHLFDDLDDAANAMQTNYLRLYIARLRRLLPQCRDVIDWAFTAEEWYVLVPESAPAEPA
jgi:hypothetical protein